MYSVTKKTSCLLTASLTEPAHMPLLPSPIHDHMPSVHHEDHQASAALVGSWSSWRAAHICPQPSKSKVGSAVKLLSKEESWFIRSHRTFGRLRIKLCIFTIPIYLDLGSGRWHLRNSYIKFGIFNLVRYIHKSRLSCSPY